MFDSDLRGMHLRGPSLLSSNVRRSVSVAKISNDGLLAKKAVNRKNSNEACGLNA